MRAVKYASVGVWVLSQHRVLSPHLLPVVLYVYYFVVVVMVPHDAHFTTVKIRELP
jgi:hypothetical protein